MGVDVEAGSRREYASAELGGVLEEGDEQTEDDLSTHPSSVDGGGQCLCEQFERQSFCRRLEEEAHVECQWLTFLKELFYHVFFPLSLPLIYWFEGGTTGIINRQYWGSRLAITQWTLAIAFYAMNVLSAFFITPDIVIANMLTVMRHMVLATKYGFYTKSDIAEMREKVLSHETLDDRTLFLAWTNPMPLRILKRQLLLAAARNNMLKCTQSLRVVPGASRNTVQEIMHQLSNEKPSEKWQGFMRSGRVRAFKSRKLSKVNVINCANCVKNSCTDRELEDRWIQLCMSRLHHDPKCHLPESSDLSPEEDSRLGSYVKEANDVGPDGVSIKEEKTMNDQVDLPALMLAAHLLQQSGYLLSKKKFGHQLLKSPMRVWFASGCVALTHTVIPYVVRGITETPFVWGGNAWYVHVANLCSIMLNFHAMTSSVSFMVAGVADFRRRYFAARLLNTLLKDGCIGQETFRSEAAENEMYSRVNTLLKDGIGQETFRPQDVEAEMCVRDLKRQEERRKSEYHTGVAVDYGHASSIIGWWAMRVLVLDFGLVFSKRVKYYASYFCIYCGVTMAFLLIVLFTKGTRDSAFIMGVVTFDLIVFIGLLALIVFPGGETNKMHLGHGATLVFKKMELATKLRGPLDGAPPKQREAYNFALEVMGTVSEALAWDNTITKVTILGFKAGSEVITALLGFGGAAIGIVAQQFTSYIGGTTR